jgi:hypothetical protein
MLPDIEMQKTVYHANFPGNADIAHSKIMGTVSAGLKRSYCY